MTKMKEDTPTNLVAEYGLAEQGEEDSIILKVRINDKPVELVLVFALVTDAEELHSRIGKVISGWPRDEAPE